MGAEVRAGTVSSSNIQRHTSIPRQRGLAAASRGYFAGYATPSRQEFSPELDAQQDSGLGNNVRAGNGATRPLIHAFAALPALASFCQAHLSVLHAIITVYPWPFYALMAFMPRSQVTKRFLTGAKSLIPLAVLYGMLLCASWTPDTLQTLMPGDAAKGIKSLMQGKPEMHFIPEVDSVGKLLAAPIASVSAWAHLQFIAFFCARWIWLDGVMNGVNTVHSVLLCAVLPPLGFLSHIVTCFLKKQFASGGEQGSNKSSRPAATSDAPTAAAATATDLAAAAEGESFPETTAKSASSERGSQDSWNVATAGVGVAESLSRGNGSNGAVSPASTANGAVRGNGSSAENYNSGRPGGRSSLQGRAERTGNGTHASGRRGDDDMSWLTILEPVFIQRS